MEEIVRLVKEQAKRTQFEVPPQEELKKLTGRQIAIMLENTLDHLKTEMSKAQRRTFAEYFGALSIEDLIMRSDEP